ncbi:Triacylglycerol lipase 2 [Linum perenne]
MATHHRFTRLLTVSFNVLVIALMVMSDDVKSFSFGRKRGRNIDASPIGICASSVIVHGYKCQEIDVTTEDGFILNMQRITAGRSDANRKQPVLIQHGVLVDGMTWLLNSPQQNLPLILADQGFDVWIANTRGTRFSRRHTSLHPNQQEFWNWSWDELVVYDLPAVADHVFKQTGQKMHYVGHSLVITSCLPMFSSYIGKNCCLNSSTVAVFLKNEPQSTATKNMVHLAQTVRDGVIAKFNYGKADYNMMHYGESRPPVYNLSNIPHDLPIFLSYGGQDALSDIRDVQLLLDSFRFHDVDKLTVQYVKEYAHADFIMGVNAKDIVYNQVVSFFKHHT